MLTPLVYFAFISPTYLFVLLETTIASASTRAGTAIADTSIKAGTALAAGVVVVGSKAGSSLTNVGTQAGGMGEFLETNYKHSCILCSRS